MLIPIVRTYLFQSTLPRRERLLTIASNAFNRTYFNPRSREGSDVFDRFGKIVILSISIHAPAKGATMVKPQKQQQ